MADSTHQVSHHGPTSAVQSILTPDEDASSTRGFSHLHLKHSSFVRHFRMGVVLYRSFHWHREVGYFCCDLVIGNGLERDLHGSLRVVKSKYQQ